MSLIPPALVNPASRPQAFVIPDLISYCTLDLRVHEELPRAVWESKAWMINGSDISRNEKALSLFHGLKAGGLSAILLSPMFFVLTSLCLELACVCYPLVPFHKLRVCCDFLNLLWHLDDLSDEMDDKSTVTIMNEIMAIYYHPDAHNPVTDVGKLTKRFVSLVY